jgi:hypothetical protein
MLTITQLLGLFAVMIAFVLVMSSVERDRKPRRNTLRFMELPSGIYEVHAVRLVSDTQPRPTPSVVGHLEVISHAH